MAPGLTGILSVPGGTFRLGVLPQERFQRLIPGGVVRVGPLVREQARLCQVLSQAGGYLPGSGIVHMVPIVNGIQLPVYEEIPLIQVQVNVGNLQLRAKRVTLLCREVHQFSTLGELTSTSSAPRSRQKEIILSRCPWLREGMGASS